MNHDSKLIYGSSIGYYREQLHRLRENRKSRIEQVERAKQMAFEGLRGQMLAERQRREEERERKAEEDKEWARMASARAERDRAREEAARREVRLLLTVYLFVDCLFPRLRRSGGGRRRRRSRGRSGCAGGGGAWSSGESASSSGARRTGKRFM